METVSENACFGGVQGVYRPPSEACGCDMTFGLYLPPGEGPHPVLWYLSGLTCTHENAMTKGGFQEHAAEHGIAVVFPEVLGVGYETTDAALKNNLPLHLMLTLLVAKTAATAITLASRFGGGIFSPALYLGAMAGGSFGLIAASVFPELASSEGLYSILGMGAVAAAVLGAPFSTTMIVFELTGGSNKIDAFVELMTALGDVEVSRTGVVAISRGAGLDMPMARSLPEMRKLSEAPGS